MESICSITATPKDWGSHSVIKRHLFLIPKKFEEVKSKKYRGMFKVKSLEYHKFKPPGYYLCAPEPGRLGCVISIQKGVKTVNATRAEKRLVRKQSFLLYISNRQGLRASVLQNTCN